MTSTTLHNAILVSDEHRKRRELVNLGLGQAKIEQAVAGARDVVQMRQENGPVRASGGVGRTEGAGEGREGQDGGSREDRQDVRMEHVGMAGQEVGRVAGHARKGRRLRLRLRLRDRGSGRGGDGVDGVGEGGGEARYVRAKSGWSAGRRVGVAGGGKRELVCRREYKLVSWSCTSRFE